MQLPFLGRLTGFVESFFTKTYTDILKRTLAPGLATMGCSLLHVKDLDSIAHKPDTAIAEITDNSDLGGITVCSFTRISSCLGNSVAFTTSLRRTEFVEFWFLRPVALM